MYTSFQNTLGFLKKSLLKKQKNYTHEQVYISEAGMYGSMSRYDGPLKQLMSSSESSLHLSIVVIIITKTDSDTVQFLAHHKFIESVICRIPNLWRKNKKRILPSNAKFTITAFSTTESRLHHNILSSISLLCISLCMGKNIIH